MKQKMQQCFLLATIVSCSLHSSRAQSITVGHAIPELKLTNVINSTDGQLDMARLKGKLIILDFWGTGCYSCIEAFPKMNELQKKFGDRIQIIAVNKQSRDSTLRFFSKRKKIIVPDFPFVSEDTILHRLFPHIYVPHHVWIDGNGIVRYVTSGSDTNEKNIANFLEGKNLMLAAKEDVMDFDREKPLIAEGNGRWLDRVKYYSYIMQSPPSVQAGGLRLPNHIAMSSSIEEMIKFAFSENNKFDFRVANTVMLQVKNKYEYRAPRQADDYREWFVKHTYFYELMIPEARKGRFHSIMQEDLKAFFNLDISVQKRKIKCMVLTGKYKPRADVSTGDTSFTWYEPTTLDGFETTLNEIFSNLNHPMPAINKAQGAGLVEIVVSNKAFNPFRIEVLQAELKKHGLLLVEKEWITDVLVIKERP